MKQVLRFGLFLAFVFGFLGASAQCPTSTAGILSYGGGSTVLNYNQLTPPPTYSVNPSGLPNTEFIITSYSAVNGNGDPTILAVDDDGIFLPSDFGLMSGDSFCITPFSYDITQFQAFIDSLLNGDAAAVGVPPFALNFTCCATIDLASGFILPSQIALCDTLAAYGIPNGAAITSFSQVYNLVLPVLANFGVSPGGPTISTGELDTVLQLVNDTIGNINLQSLVSQLGVPGITLYSDSICGLSEFPLCYAMDPTAALCYGIDCFDTLNYGTTVNLGICPGGSIVYNGVTYSTPGVFFDSLLTINGCDSIQVVNVANSSILSYFDTVDLCSGDTFVFLPGRIYTQPGDYEDTFATFTCDSVIFTHIRGLDTFNSLTYDTICEGDDLFGFTSTGIHEAVFASLDGCDSIRTIDLYVRPLGRDTIMASICDYENYQFGGNTYDSAGTFLDIGTGANGCDSISTLMLTVNLSPTAPPITQSGNILTAPVGFNRYQWYLNGSPLAGDTLNFFTMNTDGYYQIAIADVNGCGTVGDSMFYLASSIGRIGLENELKMYPNPTKGMLIIDFLNAAEWTESQVRIMSLTGEELIARRKDTDRMELDLSAFSSGVYLVEITSDKGKFTTRVVRY